MAGRAKKKDKDGANAPSADEIQEYFDKLHELSDEMESSAASARGEMGRVYDEATVKLAMTKGALKFLYGKQRRERKESAKAEKFDTADRDSLEKAAQSFGDDTAFGAWIAGMAKKAGTAEREAGE